MLYYYRFFIISFFFSTLNKTACGQTSELKVLDTLSLETGFILVEKGILDNERYYFFRSDKNVLPDYSKRKWRRIKRRMPEIILPNHFINYTKSLLEILTGLQQKGTCKEAITAIIEHELSYWSPGTRFVSTVFIKIKNPNRKVNNRKTFLIPACISW
jgi:hypothetical protein